MMTDDQILEVVQAHKEGKKIQGKHTSFSNAWVDLIDDPINWDFMYKLYRVAPEPRKPREWIIHIPTDAIIRRTSIEIFPPHSPAHSPGYPAPRTECVHVREVIE